MAQNQSKGRKSPSMLYLFAMAAFAAALMGLASHTLASKPSPGAFPNLDASDISASIKGATYAPVLVDRVSTINNPAIGTYLETSVSVFNSTESYIGTNSSYPATIDSSVIVMRNESEAQQLVNDTVAGLGLGVKGLQGQVLNGTQEYTYMQGNQTVTMLIIPTVAIFNRSILNSTSGAFTLPIYQFVTLFYCRNYVGSVEISGYSPNLNESIAIGLTKALYRKLAAQ